MNGGARRAPKPGRSKRLYLALLAVVPPHLLSLVLLIEPLFQWREILQHGAGVHLALAGEGVERFRPGLALAHLEHGVQLRPSSLVAVERAAIERPSESGLTAHGAKELKLQNPRQEVSRVGHVRGYVILRTRIEVGLAAWHGRCNALVLLAHSPPRTVVICGCDFAAENSPAPLIDEQAERQEGDLVEPLAQQIANVVGLRNGRQQSNLVEVLRSDSQCDGVADGLMEAVVRAALEKKW